MLLAKHPVKNVMKTQQTVLSVKMDTLTILAHVMLQQHAIQPMTVQFVLMDKFC